MNYYYEVECNNYYQSSNKNLEIMKYRNTPKRKININETNNDIVYMYVTSTLQE